VKTAYTQFIQTVTFFSASSEEFVGDLAGSAGMLTEEAACPSILQWLNTGVHTA
jgi:hypothetical protein